RRILVPTRTPSPLREIVDDVFLGTAARAAVAPPFGRVTGTPAAIRRKRGGTRPPTAGRRGRGGVRFPRRGTRGRSGPGGRSTGPCAGRHQPRHCPVPPCCPSGPCRRSGSPPSRAPAGRRAIGGGVAYRPSRRPPRPR